MLSGWSPDETFRLSDVLAVSDHSVEWSVYGVKFLEAQLTTDAKTFAYC